MYYYLKGTVAQCEADLAVIDCHGVGYACHTTLTTLGQLSLGPQAKLYTHQHRKEDRMDHYGFYTPEEKACFLQLIAISGVGPRSALSILSVTTPDKLALAIMAGDAKVLTQAAGVGTKLAQRIILELKDKVAKQQLAGAPVSGSLPIGTNVTGLNHLRDAQTALMVLGYSASEALQAVNGLNPEDPVESLISQALSRLS